MPEFVDRRWLEPRVVTSVEVNPARAPSSRLTLSTSADGVVAERVGRDLRFVRAGEDALHPLEQVVQPAAVMGVPFVPS